MPPAAWFTCAVVVAITWALATERGGPDLVMFCGLAVLVGTGVVELHDALMGFANPALVTIGCLFVVAAAVRETGALRLIAGTVLGNQDASFPTLRLMVPVASLSAFLNNTPIVALLIPTVRDYAQRLDMAPSKLLIPLSYAAMLGGTCTVIGTSSNLVVSGLLEQHGAGQIGMLEITWVGLPTALVGLTYMTLIGRRLLPDRRTAVVKAIDQVRHYLVEVEVAADSPLVGRSVQSAGLRSIPGLALAELRHTDGTALSPVAPDVRLQRRDSLVFTGPASHISHLRAFPGLRPVNAGDAEDEDLYEVVISHRSALVGLTVNKAEFGRRYGAAILAVHRAGEAINGKLGDIVLRPGDVLMLAAASGFYQAWRDSTAFYTVSPIEDSRARRYRYAPTALIVVAALVVVPAVTGLSMSIAAMVAVMVLLLTRCIAARGVRQSVNWTVLVLIGSAFGVARAMDDSGAATAIAELLVQVTGGLGPRGTLAGVYLVTVLFALVIGNAAAAALVFPVAIGAAQAAGLETRPMAIAVAMAASAAFSTPIGYAANLLVYGPGGYKYLDFTKVGVPLNLACMAVAVGLIPVVWPLVP